MPPSTCMVWEVTWEDEFDARDMATRSVPQVLLSCQESCDLPSPATDPVIKAIFPDGSSNSGKSYSDKNIRMSERLFER